ncbi:MAG: hypothetical protein HYX73_06975, partial [Acidobacteria bacterium]|nr:hypothetical protein [Acidobacteriota bacterium]
MGKKIIEKAVGTQVLSEARLFQGLDEASLTGPHFRYEEEALYPALVAIFEKKYIEKLLADHDRVIGSAGRLVRLAGKDAWNEGEVDEAVELVRDMLPHVSDCDGLSIMVERLPEEK